MKQAILFAIIPFLVLHFGCTPAPPIQEDQRGELAEAERDFDPLAQDQDRPIVIEEEGQEFQRSGMPPEAPGDQGDQESLTGPVRRGLAQGYRVQIFLSDNLREAARAMAEAREKFQEEVYLEYDAPYYKVRVGDCRTESEGQDLLKVAHGLGYRDAWLVYTLINVAEE